jgi:D-2-hydroxyglutarate dehydrogenase
MSRCVAADIYVIYLDSLSLSLAALERGSISAEHGLGVSKAEFIGLSKSPEMVGLMRQIKGMFDPNGIINPYKMLPKP